MYNKTFGNLNRDFGYNKEEQLFKNFKITLFAPSLVSNNDFE